MSINKIQALGKEITLPVEYKEDQLKDRLLAIIGEIDSDLADQLGGIEFTINVQNNVAVIVRDSAVMG